MEFIELEYLIALAEAKNFTRAAALLHIAQPNLSNIVSGVEKKIGYSIFERSKQGLKLTEAGAQYINTAKKIIEMKSDMDLEMEAVSSGKLGQLHMAISPFLNRCIFPAFLPDFSKKNPDITVNVEVLSPDRIMSRLEEGSLEIAVMVEGKIPQGYSCETLYYEPIVLAVSQESPLIQQSYTDEGREFPILPGEALNGEEFVLPEPNSWLKDTADQFFRENNIAPNEVVTSANMDALNRLAAMGVGIAFVPYTIAGLSKHKPAPAYFLGEKGPMSWKVCLYIRRDLEKLKYVKTFIEELKASI